MSVDAPFQVGTWVTRKASSRKRRDQRDAHTPVLITAINIEGPGSATVIYPNHLSLQLGYQGPGWKRQEGVPFQELTAYKGTPALEAALLAALRAQRRGCTTNIKAEEGPGPSRPKRAVSPRGEPVEAKAQKRGLLQWLKPPPPSPASEMHAATESAVQVTATEETIVAKESSDVDATCDATTSAGVGPPSAAEDQPSSSKRTAGLRQWMKPGSAWEADVDPLALLRAPTGLRQWMKPGSGEEAGPRITSAASGGDLRNWLRRREEAAEEGGAERSGTADDGKAVPEEDAVHDAEALPDLVDEALPKEQGAAAKPPQPLEAGAEPPLQTESDLEEEISEMHDKITVKQQRIDALTEELQKLEDEQAAQRDEDMAAKLDQDMEVDQKDTDLALPCSPHSPPASQPSRGLAWTPSPQKAASAGLADASRAQILDGLADFIKLMAKAFRQKCSTQVPKMELFEYIKSQEDCTVASFEERLLRLDEADRVAVIDDMVFSLA